MKPCLSKNIDYFSNNLNNSIKSNINRKLSIRLVLLFQIMALLRPNLHLVSGRMLSMERTRRVWAGDSTVEMKAKISW